MKRRNNKKMPEMTFDEQLEVGATALRQRQLDVAVLTYCEAIRRRPDSLAAFSGLGLALLQQGRYAEAETCFRKTVDLAPQQAEGYNNLALLFIDTKRPHEAAKALDVAAELAPDCAAVFNNRGLALEALQRPAEAEEAYRSALRLDPAYAEAHYNLGNLLTGQLRLADAEDALRSAIRCRPQYNEAIFALSVLDLMQRRYEQGWPQYDAWRMKRPALRAESSARWQGQSLHGKSMLLFYEQGFGDTFQFLRYVPLVAERAARTVLWLQPAVQELAALQDWPGIELQRGTEPPQETFDYCCPVPSLAAAFGSNDATIPNDIPYLRPDAKLKTSWSARIARGCRLQVGVVWAGNPEHHNDANRSIAFSTFAALLTMTEVDWHSLQVGPRAADPNSEASVALQTWAAELTDFSQTAAALSNLDLLIAVDSSVAHLAGALGVEVWLLVPFLPDWRWQLAREDSVWYPTMRLFRQTRAGDWDEVLLRVQEALAKKVKNVNKIY